MAKLPGKRPAGTPPDPKSSGKTEEPGRIGVDDRGNMTWEWSDDEHLQADDTLGAAERMRALVDPGLDVQNEDFDPNDPLSRIQSTGKGIKSGYNPYNSGTLGKQSWKKKKDLRKLSEWIALKKKMERKKGED